MTTLSKTTLILFSFFTLIANTNIIQLQILNQVIGNSVLGSFGSIKTQAECYDSSVTIGDAFISTYEVQADIRDINLNNNTSTIEVETIRQAETSIQMTGSTAIVPGQTSTTYNVTISNAGPSLIHFYVLGIEFNDNSAVDYISGGNLSNNYDGNNFGIGDLRSPKYKTGNGGNLVDSFFRYGTGGTIPAGGSSNFDVTVNIKEGWTGNLIPKMTVLPNYGGFTNCSNFENNMLDNQTTLTPLSSSADLSIINTSTGGSNSTTNTIGQTNQNTNLQYSLTTTNNGPDTAIGTINIVDTYDSTKIQFISSTPPNGWSCGFPNLTNPTAATITCQTPNSIINSGTVQILLDFLVL